MNNQTYTNSDMDPADRALIQSYVEKYINTGVQPTEKDKVRMLELTKKYNIKINNNPRPILSRAIRIHRNQTDENGRIIPYVRQEAKKASQGAMKKELARLRKQDNRDNR